MDVERFDDYCPNGLQVEANPEVRKIALGVSASLQLFQKARAQGADTVIVHHGLFWHKMSYALKGVHGKRVAYLFQNKINLFGFHLPLDYQPKIGNNAAIANHLRLKKRRHFARHGGVAIGMLGQLPHATPLAEVEQRLRGFFGQINYFYDCGKPIIKSVAMVSGGAAEDVHEAHALGADLYITGEAAEPTQEWCREAGMNFIGAGHYASEQFGVQGLGKIIQQKFKIPCEFIPIQNRF